MDRSTLLTELKQKEELDPDKYDGSYELVRGIVEAYSKKTSYEDIDYNDLNAVYLMAIGTWRHNAQRKKESIKASHLNDFDKEIMCELIDHVWDNACFEKYENARHDGKPSIGMFGTGFLSFKGKTTDECAKNFIRGLILIKDRIDDNSIFSCMQSIISERFQGMRAASASVILHCLKPMVFPIINGNRGCKSIYSEMGIALENPSSIETYIENCRKIKEFRDANFPFKNYRILDMASWELDEEVSMSMTNFALNTILYGPPGTGKTYNTARYAVAICNNLSLDEVNDIPYKDVMTEYHKLSKEGRIVFTTFHQSYGYEEFIEGIKPVLNGDGNIGYTIEDGVFKSFCKRAAIPDEIDHNVNIWKAVLESGDSVPRNSVKLECINNGKILFDWKKNPEEHPGSYAANQIVHFQERVSIGDFVVSYAGEGAFIDAIGIITGDAEYDETKDRYRWSRSVEWLQKGVRHNIRELNGGKHLDNSMLQPLSRLTVPDLYKLMDRDNNISQNKNYVFIIDEINRGNMSKIFGELITLIEDTKRDGCAESASAALPYSHEVFSVPNNVFILGTMNTADRSIALMDTALRRRFQFIEMMPDSDVLRAIGADKVEDLDVAKMLDVMNERIAFLYDREHTIGHAFFTKLAMNPTVECLQSIFEKSVIPLLQEYFYEDYQKIQLVLGDNGKSEDSHKFILDEEVKVKSVFKGNAEDFVDLPEKKYSINKAALEILDSYKEIM